MCYRQFQLKKTAVAALQNSFNLQQLMYIQYNVYCILYIHHESKPATTKLFSSAEIGGNTLISLVFVNKRTPKAVSHIHGMGFGQISPVFANKLLKVSGLAMTLNSTK